MSSLAQAQNPARLIPIQERLPRLLDVASVHRLGRRGAVEVVDGKGDAARGGEIGIAQRQADGTEIGKLELQLPLDDGAVVAQMSREQGSCHDRSGFRRPLEHFQVKCEAVFRPGNA